MSLQPVQEVYTTEELNVSNTYTIALGDEIKYYQIPSYNDTNFLTSSLSHLWSFFNLRTETDYNLANLPYTDGGRIGTALEQLPEAFWNKGAIGFSLSNSNYRVQVYGQNTAIQIPLDSTYTGMTSGLTGTTLYSSLVYNSDILIKNPYNLCSGTKADSFKSEPSKAYTNDIGIGYAYIDGKNPNPEGVYKFYDSGVVYLVSNDVNNSFSGATGSSTSWGYLYGQTSKYSNGAPLISFDPTNTQFAGVGGYDRIVGAMFLNYGFGFIFDPELTQAFDWATVNGDPTSLTGGTFTSGSTAYRGQDLDLAEILNVKIIADGNTWKSSSNTSYIGTNADCGVATTTITLHDSMGMCLAVAKPDEALIKTDGKYLIFDLQLPLSENIQTSLADTRGVIDNIVIS